MVYYTMITLDFCPKIYLILYPSLENFITHIAIQGMDQCLDEDDQKEALDTDQDMEDLMNWSKNG